MGNYLKNYRGFIYIYYIGLQKNDVFLLPIMNRASYKSDLLLCKHNGFVGKIINRENILGTPLSDSISWG